MDAMSLKDFNIIMETENPEHKITFQWSIRNIHKLPGIIRSSKFSLVPGQPGDWDVSIRRESNGKFEFYLGYHAQNNAVPIRVESLSRILKNEISVLVRDYRSVHLFNSGDRLPMLTGVVFPKESEDDKLVFQCFMTVRGYGLLCSRDLYSDDSRLDVEQLRIDFLSMMRYRVLSDVSIVGADRCFNAHKCVLKSLAPKFYDFYLEEILKGIIRFATNSQIIFENILPCIYVGKPLAKFRMSMYGPALKYGLGCLRRPSIREVVFGITTDNVYGFYQIAQDAKDEKMLDYCKAFMKDNLRELESHELYRVLAAANPDLPRSISGSNEKTVVDEDESGFVMP